MNTEYKCVTTVDGIEDYIGGCRIVAFDFETAPDDPYRAEDKAAIMQSIIEKTGPGTPSGAICFSLPVSQVAGLRRIEE